MQYPKFSPAELSVLSDQSFMPLKARADAKIKQLFGHLKQRIAPNAQEVANLFPEEGGMLSGRISRGENYKTFAYRVLDMPAFFRGEDIFAFRIVLLWGHHFGLHLILQGKPLDRFRERLLENQTILTKAGLLLSQQKSPWEWEIGPESHVSCGEISAEKWDASLREAQFLKFTRKAELRHYEQLPEIGAELWQTWNEVLLG